MREACLGRARASRALCFQLCFWFKERAAQTAAEVHADVAADRPTPLNIREAPTTERRRRGSSGRTAQREAV
jgi:hypothetical protein